MRLLWPFFRVSGPSVATGELLARARERIGVCDLARPEGRLGHRAMTQLLDAWMATTGDPAVGLRAGSHVEAGDLGVVEYAARSCPDLREAVRSIARHIQLVDEAAEISLAEYGDRALWRFVVNDGVLPSRASNDFVVACAARFARRYAAIGEPPHEVHLMHEEPADLAPYDVFRARVRFSMPHNGLVFSRMLLDRPMLQAHATLHEAFEGYAREQSEHLELGVSGRVADIVRRELPRGGVSMEAVAATFGASVATLRRRLEQDGTTFSALVDRIRLELAEQHLHDPRRRINEIAFLVGFAHAPAFHKAFRRWTGRTPSERRAEILS